MGERLTKCECLKLAQVLRPRPLSGGGILMVRSWSWGRRAGLVCRELQDSSASFFSSYSNLLAIWTGYFLTLDTYLWLPVDRRREEL